MKRDLEREYQDNVGHPPPVDESDEAWQWDYRGRSEEDRERLDVFVRESQEQPEEQESLF